MTDQIIEYRRRFDSFLQIIANNLEDMLREYLVNLPRIDRISARAKEPEKFEEKANRKKDDNSLIYNFPPADASYVIATCCHSLKVMAPPVVRATFHDPSL